MKETVRTFKWGTFIGVLLLFLVIEAFLLGALTILLPPLTHFQPDGLSIRRVDADPGFGAAAPSDTSPNGLYRIEDSSSDVRVVDAASGEELAVLHVNPSSDIIGRAAWQDDETILLAFGMGNPSYAVWKWQRNRLITPLRLALAALILLPLLGAYLSYNMARRP